jgi:hypothetical protein
MVNQKLNRPKMVKRTHSLFEWQDKGLEKMVQKMGESKDYHLRIALSQYLFDNLGASVYKGTKEKDVKKK